MADKQDYGYKAALPVPYEQAVERVTAALKEQGFGVLTEIDVKATMKKKLDVDTRKYVILGACNPPLAYQALEAEPDIGLLLPCNVIVYEDEASGGSVVSIVNPMAMMQVTGNPALNDVAEQADSRLQQVIEALS